MLLYEYLNFLSDDIISTSNLKDIEICNITDNSRSISDKTIFIAVKGSSLDGHSFIDDAISSGAEVILHQEEIGKYNDKTIYIQVLNSYLAYAKLLEVFYGFPASKMKMIGITGTNGKTTCAFIINHILKSKGYKTGLITTVQYSYGNTVIPAKRTTPGPLELQQLFSGMFNDGCEYIIMEISSHSLIQNRLGCTKFSATLFTNLSGDHLDYHGNMENYYLAKKLLFTDYNCRRAVPALKGSESPVLQKSCTIINRAPKTEDKDTHKSKDKTHHIVNYDDSYGQRLISDLKSDNVTTYGKSTESDFIIEYNEQHCSATMIINNCRHKIVTSLIGEFNIYNIAGAIALCSKLGVPVKSSLEAVKSFKSAPGRLEGFKTQKGTDCYVDYAHTDDALKRALKALKQINPNKLIVVFGCGGDRDKSKRPRMGKAASTFADIIIITDDNPRTENSIDIINDIKPGISFNSDVIIIPERKKAIYHALNIAKEKDIVLIAGKGHEDYQEIGTLRVPFDDADVIRSFINES